MRFTPTPVESYSWLAHINPVLTGLVAAQNVQKMQSQGLMDQARGIQNQYLQPLLQDKLQQAQTANQLQQAQLPLVQAKTKLEQYLAEHPGANTKFQNRKLIATPQGYVQYDMATGQSTPVLDAQGKPVMPMSHGLSITQTPGGGWSIQEGRLVPTQTGATQATQGATQGATPQGGTSSNIVVSPASPHSSRSTGGMTLMDTGTGSAISVPTRQTVSKFQQALAAENVASPLLKAYYAQISPLAGRGHIGKRLIEGIEGSPAYSRYSAAVQGAPNIAEQLLRANNVNTTEQNLTRAIGGIRPNTLDTADTVKRKIANTVADIMLRGNTYRKYLKGGISLDDPKDRTAFLQALQNKIYNELSQEDRVHVSKGGQLYAIPRNQLSEAIKQGYKEEP